MATTGTIDADGNVGPVGGIRQKTHLVVRQGVPLFLVPAAEEAEDARAARRRDRHQGGSGVRRWTRRWRRLRPDKAGAPTWSANEAAQRAATTGPGSPSAPS